MGLQGGPNQGLEGVRTRKRLHGALGRTREDQPPSDGTGDWKVVRASLWSGLGNVISAIPGDSRPASKTG